MRQNIGELPALAGVTDRTALAHPHAVTVTLSAESHPDDIFAGVALDVDIKTVRREDQVGIGSSPDHPADTIFLEAEKN